MLFPWLNWMSFGWLYEVISLVKIKSLLAIQGPRSIYVYSLLIGLFSGVGAYGFNILLSYTESLTFSQLIGYDPGVPAGDSFFSFPFAPRQFSYLWLFLLPALGGLLSGLIIYFLCPEAAGGGTDSLIKSFHFNEGKIPAKLPFYKALVTIITLGSGGSGGKEGPTAQIGAGFGSTLGSLLGVGARARRTLMLAGTAGGLGAIFRAPLGGAITAVEMVYKEDIESDSLVPCILSSVSAYLTYSSLAGKGSVFAVAEYSLSDYRHIPFYIILGLVCFAIGFLFVNFYHFVKDHFAAWQIPNYLKPAIGGLVVGSLAIFFPEVLGSGFGLLQKMVNGDHLNSYHFSLNGPVFFLTIALVKIVSTSFTVGSGSSAGLLGPSFFIGGMLGAFVGSMAQILFPSMGVLIFPFMLVGMGSFFAGVARAPIAGMVMVCDMIGSYELLPPLMIVSVIAAILSNKISIYRHQVQNRFQSPSHHWDMNQDIMDRISISKHFSEFRKFAIVSNSIPLTELQTQAPGIQASDFILTDNDQKYKGIVSLRKNRILPEYEEHLSKLITCEEIVQDVPAIKAEDTLGMGLRVMLQYDVDKVAIVNEHEDCLGYLRYIDLFRAYQSEIKLYSRKSD
ncbi:chloride channel protein [Leptospira ognonensis]|nr:chloride channel protein [Leptospira ognonensis]